MTLGDFEKAVGLCQEQFDAVVDSGTDEDLFISSYLSGHLDLMVGQAFIQQNYSFEDLNRQVMNSLDASFLNDNLTSEEQEKTCRLWQKLSSNFDE
jgi:hypothetical protein